ncbi:hypothetical protein Hanom_Chr15g01340951 [Helianthus anomalus]
MYPSPSSSNTLNASVISASSCLSPSPSCSSSSGLLKSSLSSSRKNKSSISLCKA